MSGFSNDSSLQAAKSQANYLFEGDFKRKPNQNLSGASRLVGRQQLLHEAALQRQDREDKRQREQSSIKIQALWRGYICRRRLAKPMREKFDTLLSSKCQVSDRDNLHDEVLNDLIQRLLLFYNTKIDQQRFNSMIDLLITKPDLVLEEKQKNPRIWLFRIIKLLKINLCCLSLKSQVNDIRNLSFIELYTRDNILDTKEQDIVWKTLVANNLFSILRDIVDENGTPSSNYDCERTDTQVDQTILEIVRRSVDVEDTKTDDRCYQSIGTLCTTFLRGPLNSFMEKFYLKNLLVMKPKGFSSKFFLKAFDVLLSMKDCIHKLPKLTNKTQYSDRAIIEPYLRVTWLSYTLVSIVHSQINELTDTEKSKYLNILALLISPIDHLSNFANSFHQSQDDTNIIENNDGDDDDDDPNETGLTMSLQAQANQELSRDIRNVINKLVSLINCQSHVDSLKSILFSCESKSQTLTSTIKICNFTLSNEELAIFNCPLLFTIAFNWEFLRKLWQSILSTCNQSLFGYHAPIYMQITKGDVSISPESWEAILPRLKLFCSVYSYLLPTLDDEEFYSKYDDVTYQTGGYNSTASSSLHGSQATVEQKKSSSAKSFFIDKELVAISGVLRDICVGMIEIIYHENKYIYRSDQLDKLPSSSEHTTILRFNIRSCFRAIVRVVCQIHARDSRRQFCPTGHWICPTVLVSTDKAIEFHSLTTQYGRLLDQIETHNMGSINPIAGALTSAPEIKGLLILQEIPFVTPFHDRVQMFHQLINQEKRLNTSDGYFFGLQGHAISLQVRRNYIYEDAFRKLARQGSNYHNMKSPLKVSLINAVGVDEAGIDGGGVTKEFLSELLKAGFDPMRGFFKSTVDHQLFPNPSANVLFSTLEEGYIIHFEFLGKMLGKALMEKVMVELPFASFFLAKILARTNESDVDWHNLASLDPIIYKNLVYLKNYQSDVADLNLDFTITNNELDEKEVVELKPGGSKIPVTRSNRVEYIHLVADYRLNKQIRSQCAAFKKGLSELIDLDWLRIFDPRELQILISGAPISIDIADWRRHTIYGNGYTEESEVIETFWRVVNTLDEAHKRKLLKFATSCSNPPLLGFRDLYPQFTIAPSEETRLPTASTCMNLLKLPKCKDESTMRSKLLYAIDSNSGFDLS